MPESAILSTALYPRTHKRHSTASDFRHQTSRSHSDVIKDHGRGGYCRKNWLDWTKEVERTGEIGNEEDSVMLCSLAGSRVKGAGVYWIWGLNEYERLLRDLHARSVSSPNMSFVFATCCHPYRCNTNNTRPGYYLGTRIE